MATFLKVLTVFFLILTIGALVLGIHLFEKRELLKGRTQKLEKAIIALGTVTEDVDDEAMVAEAKKDYPAKDVSDCRAEILETPELSKFWDTYQAQFEFQPSTFLNLGTPEKKIELMTYYKRDPVTQKIIYDEFGRPVTDGPNTMQSVIDLLQKKQREQLKRLNDTRDQLKKLREEYVLTVIELNKWKRELRERLVEIVQLKQKIAELEAKIRELEAKIQQLENEKKALEEEVQELRRQITELNDIIANKDILIKNQSNEIARLKGIIAGAEGPIVSIDLPPGQKGAVVSVNEDWNFVVVELTDECMKQLLGDDLQRPLPTAEFWVRRRISEERDAIMGRVRLREIRREKKLGIADVLLQYKQGPLLIGDVVFVQ